MAKRKKWDIATATTTSESIQGGNGVPKKESFKPNILIDEYGLKDKERLFVEEYLIDFNASRAYVAAGYDSTNPTSYKVQACNLRRKPSVHKAIEKLKGERLEDLGLSQERLLLEYSRVAYANLADYYEYDEQEGWRAKDLGQLTADQKAAISDIVFVDKKRVNFSRDGESAAWTKKVARVILQDKMKAMEALAKYHGLFKEGAGKGSGIGATVEDILREFPEELAYLVRKQMFSELVSPKVRDKKMPDSEEQRH